MRFYLTLKVKSIEQSIPRLKEHGLKQGQNRPEHKIDCVFSSPCCIRIIVLLNSKHFAFGIFCGARCNYGKHFTNEMNAKILSGAN